MQTQPSFHISLSQTIEDIKMKKQKAKKHGETEKEMRNLGIEPRAPRRCSNGNGEFYH
jgi:hypothetical protein